MVQKKQQWPTLLVVVVFLILSACGNLENRKSNRDKDAPRTNDGYEYSGTLDTAPSDKPANLNSISDAVPKHLPLSRYGNPQNYVVRGKSYRLLKSRTGYVEQGKASWYGTKFHGRRTSSGETYNMYQMTAAHKTLPIPVFVTVENLDNGKKIVVKVNDRGPFHAGRIIDLSYVAALKLGVVKSGTANVEVKTVSIAGLPDYEESLFVQLGAFADRDNAKYLQRKLARADINSQITKLYVNASDAIYRLRVGPFSQREKANQMIGELENLGVRNAKVLSGSGE